MALQDQTLSISFNKGLNTKSDPKQIMPGELLTLQNGIFTSVQEILKRNGYAALNTTTFSNIPLNITSGVALGVLNSKDLILLDGDNILSYSPSLTTFINEGLKSQINITESTITSVSAGVVSVSGSSPGTGPINQPTLVPSSSGVELSTYLDSTNTINFYSYIDSGNKQQIKTDAGTFLGAPNAFTSNELHLFSSTYAGTNGVWLGVTQQDNGTATSIQVIRYGAPSNGISPAVTIATPKSTLATSSVLTPVNVSTVSATSLYLLYLNTTGDLILSQYDNTMTLVNTTTVLPVDPSGLTSPTYLSIAYDSTNSKVVVGYTVSGNSTINGAGRPYLAVYSSTLTPVIAGTPLAGVGDQYLNVEVAFSGTTLGYFLNSYTVTTLVPFVTAGIITNYFTTPVTTFTSKLAHLASVCATPFSQNGNFYCPLNFPGNLTSNGFVGQTYFILEYSPLGLDSIPGKYSYQTALAGGTGGKTYRTQVSPTGSFVLPYYKAVNTAVFNGVATSVYNIAEVEITFDYKFQTLPLAQDLNISGPVVTLYDGKGIAESGFHIPPSANVTIAGAGSIAAGTYEYIALYEWTDLQGNIHRSTPSLPVTKVLTVAGGTVVKIPYLGLSEPYKRPGVKAKLYRTQNTGTIFYLVGSGNNSPALANSGYISISDSSSDASIAGNQQLYTTGGEVDNTAPSGFTSFTSFKNRIIGISTDDPLVWWYSKQVIEGFPVEFSDLFTQVIDQRGGPLTSVATMDDKLIFFKEYNIFYVTGDGPAPSGANNDFSYPQIITTDSVGCIDPKSILLIPNGLLFKSHKGIYLLDRALGCSYIGANVESFNQYTVVSSCVVPGTTQARLTLSNGSILVYDYLVGQWSEFTNLLAVDSVVYNNKYTLLSPTGVVTQETPGLYTDSGAAIPLTIKTGWFSFGNLQGFQRIKEFLILGESESNTSLTVSLSHNFLPTINQTDVIPITASSRLQYRIFPQRQKCESMQITISDNPTGTLGEGVRISALGFNVGIKKGLNKVPASNNFG